MDENILKGHIHSRFIVLSKSKWFNERSVPMSEENKPKENNPEEEQQEIIKPTDEITEQELDDISGGDVQVHDLVITKWVDKASTKLF